MHHSLFINVFLAGTFGVSIGQAQFTGNCADGRPGTTIVFVNGVKGEMSAAVSQAELEILVRTAIQGTRKENACLLFLNAINPSNGIWSDLLESAKQRLGESDAGLVLADVVSGISPVQDWIREYFESNTSDSLKVRAIPPSAQPAIDEHAATYEGHLSVGNNIIIVGHSQGNFFANEEYAVLQRRSTLVPSRVKVIGVATPDSYIAGGGPYTTLCSDIIWRVPLALSYNVNNNPFVCNPVYKVVLWQHAFSKYYLRFKVSC